jgi:hypothetical protein
MGIVRALVRREELDPKDEDMLRKMFRDAIRSKSGGISEEVEDRLQEIIHGDHVKDLMKIVRDEGFAEDDDEAYSLVIDLEDLWYPFIARIIHETIKQGGY